jgi:hypothetical protein
MNKKFTAIIVFILCILFINANAQINTDALPWGISAAYKSFMTFDVHQQYADRQKEFAVALTSKEAMLKYRDDCIQRYKKIIGDLPEESSINAKVVGTSQHDGFHVEKIIFESIPKRYVTADLYIPDGKGPFPVALSLLGHNTTGKIPGYPTFALNGMAVMVIDPIGQGERIQFVDQNNLPITRGSTTEHTLLNQGANLLGSSFAFYEYWDNHRAIDYLVTRPDIDKSRIGVHGSSGGGNQTMYMLGLDKRIMVAAIGVFFSQRENMLELYGPKDGCQHIPYEGREHLEVADFVIMFAPKPVFIMAGRYDSNADYWGTIQAFGELKKAYSILGSPEKVSMLASERGHEITKEHMETLITWFRRWMLGDSTSVHETRRVMVPDSDLQCTSIGQVNATFPDAVSIPAYHLALYDKFAKQRADFVKSDKSVVTKKVMELLGITIPAEKIVVEETGSAKFTNFDIKKYQITRVGQMPVPCVVLIPFNIKPGSPIMLYLNSGGKNEIMNDANTVDRYKQETIMVAADLRGFGETQDPLSLSDPSQWNREYRNAMISMHTGKPIMGQRVIDLMSILDFFASDPLFKGHKVNIVADGAYGPVVVHAAYLDQRISSAVISRSIKSFNEYLKNPLQRDIYSNVLYGVLKYYDLQDLINLTGNRVRFAD